MHQLLKKIQTVENHAQSLLLRLSKRLRLSCLVPNLHSSELSCSYIKATVCLKKRRSNGLSSFSVISLYHRAPWRTFLPHQRRIHAFTARGVILEHAVRCRASITLPATPAARLFFSPHEHHRNSFIYLSIFFTHVQEMYRNGWRRACNQVRVGVEQSVNVRRRRRRERRRSLEPKPVCS